VLWDSPGGAIPALLARVDQPAAPLALLLPTMLAEQLRPGTRKALAHLAPLCVLDGRRSLAAAGTPFAGVSLVSPTELSLIPTSRGYQLRQYGSGARQWLSGSRSPGKAR
jgi:hypothetical protein